MARTKKISKKSEDVKSQKKRTLVSQKVARKTAPVQTGVKKRRYKPGKRALKEIKQFQKTTNNLLLRAPFVRLVRSILKRIENQAQNNRRISHTALEALQTATEAAIISLYEDSGLCMTHAKRVTLFNTDIALARRIRGDKF